MGAVLLYGSVLLWGILCGAMVYEHLAIVPQWTANPPESLHMWKGPYRVAAQHFWPAVHPIALLLIAGALGFNWNNPARNLIAAALAVYLLAILLPTAFWYVPELLKLTNPDTALPPAQWRSRAKRWERLSLVRGVVVLAVIVPLVHAVAVRSS